MNKASIFALFLSAVLVLTVSSTDIAFADSDDYYDKEYEQEHEKEHSSEHEREYDDDEDCEKDDYDDDDRYQEERRS